MNPTPSQNPKTSSSLWSAKPGPSAVFDHERLDVYQLELQFISWLTPVLEGAKSVAAGKTREICDQLDRASLSALLNTAEGNGKRRGQGRAKFFDDARGSATECAACLDALVAKAVFPDTRLLEGKSLLIRIVSMLCGLVDRFDQTGQYMHEEGVAYNVRGSSADYSSSSSASKRKAEVSSTSTRTRTRTKN